MVGGRDGVVLASCSCAGAARAGDVLRGLAEPRARGGGGERAARAVWEAGRGRGAAPQYAAGARWVTHKRRARGRRGTAAALGIVADTLEVISRTLEVFHVREEEHNSPMISLLLPNAERDPKAEHFATAAMRCLLITGALSLVAAGDEVELVDVLRELEEQFLRASEAGKPVVRMLEAGKVQLEKGILCMKQISLLQDITPRLSGAF
ncbi:hypothetical protein SELMODRAFT_410739 [Selaginella moellendorffii]|uniref:DUF632 domain-containing protein n=1 Tax=Selaginella moellendorffii TaxID=88036 RepID=D8RFQ5_SELML|nr:hypothetical protein SELMODRAFT_410739 [Selaginella moellendorffii]